MEGAVLRVVSNWFTNCLCPASWQKLTSNPVTKQFRAMALLLTVILSNGALPAQVAVTLAPQTSPASGQPGVTTIGITGSSFPAGAILPAAIDVKLEPSAGGPPVTTKASTITTVAGTTRRVAFVIPATIAVAAPTSYLVSLSGATSTGTAFASSNKAALTINPAPILLSAVPGSATPGQSVVVRLTGQYTNFVQGSTQASFGPGIAVGGAAAGSLGPVTVNSPTTATANIVVNASAAAGARDVTVRTGVQQAVLRSGFTVATAPPPVISDFSPKSAPAGTLVTVTGTNLSPNPAIILNKQGGGTINAPVGDASPTSLAFTIPPGAATGLVKVRVGNNEADSAVPLTIIPSKSFTISALPGAAELVRGQQVAFAVKLNSLDGYTSLAALSVNGLPAGVTGAFKPLRITAGQTSILTLAAPAGQSLGQSDLTIRAEATVDGLPVSATAAARINVIAPTTSFVGRTVVDDARQTPLAGGSAGLCALICAI